MFGSWFDHVKSWLNAEDKDRIMYISYEELITVRFITHPHCIIATLTIHSPAVSVTDRDMRCCMFGAGPEGLCGQNRSVLGEIAGC